MKTVLVVGRDWKFRSLLRAQLREENFEALGFESLADAADEAVAGAPEKVAALVYDTTDAPSEETGPLLTALVGRVPIIVVAAAQEAISEASLTVLRRPVQLSEVVAAVRRLVGVAS